ncbi:MAG: DUF805 domain-containing protein [Anaerolineae bacterium]
MNWYLKVLQHCFDFSGRARRTEYWTFTMFNFGISIVLGIIDFLVLGAGESGFSILSTLYMLAVLIPGVAVSVRRLHDAGYSGWYLLCAFIPLVGAFIVLYFMVSDSETGHNSWGPNPKKPKRKLAGQPA